MPHTTDIPQVLFHEMKCVFLVYTQTQGGEMVPWFKALAALTDILGLISRTQMAAHTHLELQLQGL